MTEPQVWTLIAVFAAGMFGMITVVSTMFVRVVRAEIGRLDTKFDLVNARLDNLDRDVQALVKHTFGIDRG
ncbi:hypothetical protein HQM25_16520 [Microbacterium hominis]|uniref:Uncharacterized protein n=1 Tax=Microbacterium hominis TaxID=162426 RepID=A0A7D4TQK0_9MICO|nr:hypothetical protein HQM25_16520 [Microbacterium hominis]